MDSLYDGRKKTGYSVEEIYFHAENQRLIKELRAKNGADVSEEEPSEGVVIDAGSRFEQRREEAASKAAKSSNKKAA